MHLFFCTSFSKNQQIISITHLATVGLGTEFEVLVRKKYGHRPICEYDRYDDSE